MTNTLIRRTEKVLRDAACICTRANLLVVALELQKLADQWRPHLGDVQVVQRPIKRRLPNVVKAEPGDNSRLYQAGGRLEWFGKVRKRKA